MNRDPYLFLKDIQQAIESIEKFIEDMDFDTFTQDDKTSSAVLLKFQIIGEATKKIPKRIKDMSPTIPWRNMAGMRDRLVHAYFGIDYKLVWDAIRIALPEIKPKIAELLKEIQE